MHVPSGLYAILDLPHAGGLAAPQVLGALLAGGCRCVQLRAKQASSAQRLELARALAPLCAAADAAFWINDDLELALASIPGVTGLHVGQGDLAQLPVGWRDRVRAASLGVGVSTHDLEQIERAREVEPDYLGFGPVFPTTGKRDADPVVGLAAVARACRHTSTPVVAIGGVDADRASACLQAGAQAVAMIGALGGRTQEQVRDRARAIVNICESALATRSHGATGQPD